MEWRARRRACRAVIVGSIPALDEISKSTRQTLRDVESGSRATPTLILTLRVLVKP